MLDIVVCVSGGGTNLQAIIDKIAEGRITNTRIVGVISNNYGVKALDRARAAGIDAAVVCPKDFESRDEFNRALLKKVDSYSPGLVVLAGFLVNIPVEFVRAYSNRIINIHPSLIPSFCGVGYYGLKVHEGVLARGVKVTGATVHFVDEGVDSGPIILQKAVNVEDNDDAKSLQLRVMQQAEWEILPMAIDLIANGRVKITDHKVIIEK